MKVLAVRDGMTREDRPASRILHDEENARLVAFDLLPGQEIPEHRSASTVIIQVVAGAGIFAGSDGSATLSAGDVAVYDPGEMHSIQATDQTLSFIAILTPRPR